MHPADDRQPSCVGETERKVFLRTCDGRCLSWLASYVYGPEWCEMMGTLSR